MMIGQPSTQHWIKSPGNQIYGEYLNGFLKTAATLTGTIFARP